MSWPQIELTDLSQFSACVDQLCSVGPVATTAYLFRGQSKGSWGLKPSLARLLPQAPGAEAAARIEDDCARAFKEQAHLHVKAKELPNENDQLGWWALMQHHRAPTRLLDWTASPYVAAYFASVDDWGTDGAMWVFHASSLLRTDASHSLKVSFPARPSARMVAQQGSFVYSEDIAADHEPLLDSFLAVEHKSGAGETYRKIVVPKALKPHLLRHLRMMNVTAASLFPGIDGLGAAANELIRLSTVFPR